MLFVCLVRLRRLCKSELVCNVNVARTGRSNVPLDLSTDTVIVTILRHQYSCIEFESCNNIDQRKRSYSFGDGDKLFNAHLHQ